MADVVNAGVSTVIAQVQDRHQIHFATAGVAVLATGAKLRPQALFRFGSITKTFVATVVLQLVGEGRLSLDEPVARALPGLLANGDDGVDQDEQGVWTTPTGEHVAWFIDPDGNVLSLTEFA